MSNNLIQRTISAAILAPVVLYLVYRGEWPFTAMIMIAAIAMSFEWGKMWSGGDVRFFALTSALLIGALYLVAMERYDDSASVIFSGCLIYFFVPLRGGLAKPFGLLYIYLPCLALIWLRKEGGMEVLLWLMLCVWATDIGAYIAGKTIGGPKIAPIISPSKTWAGLFGGMALSILTTYLMLRYHGVSGSAQVYLYAVLITVVSQAGDFLESWMKRKSGVKDSGNIIPGHGGILDRVDGLLAAAVFFAVYFYIYSRFFDN